MPRKPKKSVTRRKTGPRYTAVQTAAHLECSVARVRQLARLHSIGRMARGRWWFSWADVEKLRHLQI